MLLVQQLFRKKIMLPYISRLYYMYTTAVVALKVFKGNLVSIRFGLGPGSKSYRSLLSSAVT